MNQRGCMRGARLWVARVWGALLWSALLALSGCIRNPCDAGYYEDRGACLPDPVPTPDAGDNGDGDGDGEDAGDDDGGPGDREPMESPADPYAGFGDACTDQDDCPESLVCGAPMLPQCTRTNCMGEADACPPRWTCLDITGASPDPSVTSVCLNLSP